MPHCMRWIVRHEFTGGALAADVPEALRGVPVKRPLRIVRRATTLKWDAAVHFAHDAPRAWGVRVVVRQHSRNLICARCAPWSGGFGLDRIRIYDVIRFWSTDKKPLSISLD